jgi:hypothetical protein
VTEPLFVTLTVPPLPPPPLEPPTDTEICTTGYRPDAAASPPLPPPPPTLWARMPWELAP